MPFLFLKSHFGENWQKMISCPKLLWKSTSLWLNVVYHIVDNLIVINVITHIQEGFNEEKYSNCSIDSYISVQCDVLISAIVLTLDQYNAFCKNAVKLQVWQSIGNFKGQFSEKFWFHVCYSFWNIIKYVFTKNSNIWKKW